LILIIISTALFYLLFLAFGFGGVSQNRAAQGLSDKSIKK
tara:strand:- start:727 stop:846 length:120 start_codon:yes stop_codon:yes gene_type:complete